VLTGITDFTDNVGGHLSGIADLINLAGSLAPDGTLADITFEALAVGTTPLTLSNAFLTDNGIPLSSPGEFFRHKTQ
jgi:hypothetical protein